MPLVCSSEDALGFIMVCMQLHPKMTTSVFAAAVLHQFALFCEEHLNHIPKDYLNQPFEIPTELLGKSGYELRKAVTIFLKKSYPLMYRSIVNGEYNPKYV